MAILLDAGLPDAESSPHRIAEGLDPTREPGASSMPAPDAADRATKQRERNGRLMVGDGRIRDP
jgi:hypothetical protein